MPRLAAGPPCQVIGHHIGGNGHQHQNDRDHQAPIMMRMFPIRTMKTLVIIFDYRVSVVMMIMSFPIH